MRIDLSCDPIGGIGVNDKNPRCFKFNYDMENHAYNNLKRLEQILLSDKVKLPERFNEIVRRDLEEVLSSYFELDAVRLEILPLARGVEIIVTADASRVKTLSVGSSLD
jgi:hypothetical protein